MSYRPHNAPRGQSGRRGTVLIITMVICFALAGTVLALSRSMRVETIASANLAASIQAGAVERGAEQYVLALIAQQGDSLDQLSESEFAGVPIGQGYFWVVRPDQDDATQPIFGLTDENAKLNINTASYDQMLRLPGMTEDAAASIMDWRDDDTNPERTGVETYLDQADPYIAKNGPFETIEELLLVHGIDRLLLYGDGTAPPLGSTPGMRGNTSSAGMMSDPQLARGIYDCLTLYSNQPNTTADGQNRININERNQRTQLRDRLKTRLPQASRADEITNAMGRNPRFRDIFEFATRVNIKPDELDLIADDLTTTNDRTLRGRINIRTAPRAVLACLDGIDSTDVDKLLAARPAPGTSAASPNAVSWVSEALGTKAVGLGGLITTRSSQYSADIVAVSAYGRAFKHVRIVVDAVDPANPVIVFRRDLTDRGWPMDPQLLASIRAGQGPGNLGTGFSGGGS